MLTLDTSALIAAAFGGDRYHAQAVDALKADPGPFMVPMAILSEAGYMIGTRAGVVSADRFLDDLENGLLSLHCGDDDLPRIRELLSRYRDLSFDFSDAAVIACAERFGGRVLTFDRRDFDVVARGEHGLVVLP